jgi:hypothetical protein
MYGKGWADLWGGKRWRRLSAAVTLAAKLVWTVTAVYLLVMTEAVDGIRELDDGYLMMSSRVVVNRSLVAVRGQWRASCFGHCYVVAQEGGCIGERGMDGVSR